MLLAEFLPQSTLVQIPMEMSEADQKDEFTKLSIANVESKENETHSVSSIKIPLVSFQPILVTSPEFILVNENTKRRNNLVIYDQHFQRFDKRLIKRDPLLDGLWNEDEKQFLLLTTTDAFTFDPMTGSIDSVPSLIPTDNKEFKCFTFLNQLVLLIAYDEWGAKYIEQWQKNNKNGSWKLIDKLPINLSDNEFLGSMLSFMENNGSYIALTIYNYLTEQWRLEIRNTETLVCENEILLPSTNIAHDYRMVPIKNTQEDIKFLVFSSMNSNIIVIDSQWKKQQLNYKHPVQRMALFQEKKLIVRITERVDVHLFM